MSPKSEIHTAFANIDGATKFTPTSDSNDLIFYILKILLVVLSGKLAQQAPLHNEEHVFSPRVPGRNSLRSSDGRHRRLGEGGKLACSCSRPPPGMFHLKHLNSLKVESIKDFLPMV
ncbi:unnamed protein product [Fraxinus pennsylvanica]|uniref:Uncharacterized protein n=1 Tax=Fraxinus pennsylvanica TaxID=56036 RepID=A0AAD1YW15_9LAMI|nr:unnamed protein product [Fraxinus pennsylvanica]